MTSNITRILFTHTDILWARFHANLYSCKDVSLTYLQRLGIVTLIGLSLLYLIVNRVKLCADQHRQDGSNRPYNIISPHLKGRII